MLVLKRLGAGRYVKEARVRYSPDILYCSGLIHLLHWQSIISFKNVFVLTHRASKESVALITTVERFLKV